MKLHDIHIDYVLKQPFLHKDNELLTFFALIDRFDPVERLRMLDLTCGIFGINVDIPYWNDDDYCQEVYDKFEAKAKRLATTIGSNFLTFLIVHSVLCTLWDRCDKGLVKGKPTKSSTVARHFRARVKAGLKNRSVVDGILRLVFSKEPGSYESSATRYALFCEGVVKHLM